MGVITRDEHGFPVMFASAPKAPPRADPPRRETELGGELLTVVSTGEAAAMLGLDAQTTRQLLAASDTAAVLAWKREDVQELAKRLPELFESGQLKRVEGKAT